MIFVYVDWSWSAVLDRTKELEATFRTWEAASAYIERSSPPDPPYVFTAEHRQRLSDAKRGDKNPHADGLTDAHRAKIAATMAGRNRGPDHPRWGHRHRPTSRLKTSQTMRGREKRRWCVDELGNEHLVLGSFTLPRFWCWGRRRDSWGRFGR